MSADVINFPADAEKDQILCVSEKPSDTQHVIELEHEILELRMTVSEMALELYRCRQQLGSTG